MVAVLNGLRSSASVPTDQGVAELARTLKAQVRAPNALGGARVLITLFLGGAGVQRNAQDKCSTSGYHQRIAPAHNRTDWCRV